MNGGGLPLGGGNVANRRKTSWIAGRLKSGRLRWVLLVGCIVIVFVWSRGGEEKEAIILEPEVGLQDFERAKQPIPAQIYAPEYQEDDVPIPKPAPPRPPLPAAAVQPKLQPKPLPPPVSDSKAPPLDNSPIDVPIRPATTSLSISHSTSERFLAYSPHSGYHNQRISLENALTLAYLLDRTLLLPPIWLGHAIPYISFDKLQRRLEMASKSGLEERCIPFGEGDGVEPIPRECQGFWDWTLVDWSFLVDIDKAEELVPIKRRWNLSTEWMEDEFGLRKPNRKGEGGDTYWLKDDTMYQYRFYDSKEDQEPLDKWGNRIDIDEFKEKTMNYRLVHVGTMFGTSRLRTTGEKAFDARSTFRRAMVFRNEAVDQVTEEIRDKLGGEGKYYGLHLRVGDGVFQKMAKENMRGVWEKLCKDKMKLDKEICDEVRSRSERERSQGKVRRSEIESSEEEEERFSNSTTQLVKRANSRPQREGAFHHAPLPPLPKIRTLADSPLSPSLTCRRPLHTAPHLIPFNAPLYIATDSKLPHQDPHLSLFFDAFPCTFTLSDFSSLDSLDRMNRLRNAEDKTPLAQFLYPQLDAQIAAWGRGLIGTPQSTYSRFAIDVLHQMYQ